LAAIDMGPTSEAVLDAAAALAQDLGVQLRVTHAVPLPFVGTYPDMAMAYTPAVLARDEEAAAVSLSGAVERVRGLVKTRTDLGVGDAATHILGQAVRVAASAIVIGRHTPGRRLGSVAGTVVRAADRPVIVVPSGFSRET
jgi:nucleotide-binding universal stress UspA family protein